MVAVRRDDGGDVRQVPDVERGIRVEEEPGLVVPAVVLHPPRDVRDRAGLAEDDPRG
jgi:hypothetical protein